MKTTGNDIRQTFLDFFAKQGHANVASSPLVPHNDPTLMFTNAGMVQFKDLFTGKEKRDYTRAASSQKCVRAGGKHNDLENVGYTARHHTFFEMLGNFSFGDYFKDEAIKFAWDLITKEYGLKPEKLLVTVYKDDDEAFNIWKKLTGFADQKIIRIGDKKGGGSDNFWAMGPTGPCGPCTEIFYDHGDKIPGGPPGSKDEDGDRFIEIWNLVFMQYEQVDEKTRVNLPKPSIDTGMGLERITAVLQNVHNNYDTDIFQHLITSAENITGVKAKGDALTSHRVIADHVRAVCFLMADGVLPSNEGRGYVLRRIMRRAMRHAHILGCKEPLIHKLVPALIEQMGAAYPELDRARALMQQTLENEETRFKQTLDRGLKLLEDETSKLKKGGVLSGETAFKLYDTYGFPLDLTQDILRAQNMAVDQAGFDGAMQKQKELARKSWAGSGETATEEIWFDIREQTGATEFLGYTTQTAQARVAGLIQNGKPIKTADKGDVMIITNQTPFYGESGGQMGDTGTIKKDGVEITITDTLKKLGDVHVHVGKIKKGKINVGDDVALTIDAHRRDAIRANHSATHLLHEALRRHLGDHVTQKGSLVAPDRLRFDIAHPKSITDEQLRAIENEVNERIRLNTPVETKLMSPDEAIKAGAMALFGEKYGDEVRVLSMGGTQEKYSVELCGGTHVKRTGDIGVFIIINEGAVGAGIRRIEAMTGVGALQYINTQRETLTSAAQTLKTTPEELNNRLASLLDDRKKLERDLSDTRKKLASGGGGKSNDDVKDIGGIKFMHRALQNIPAKELKSMADELKQQIGSGVVAIAAAMDGKASLVVAVTEDLTGKLNAVDLVKIGALALGGQGGGGRPDMAQAGGPGDADITKALTAIESAITNAA